MSKTKWMAKPWKPIPPGKPLEFIKVLKSFKCKDQVSKYDLEADYDSDGGLYALSIDLSVFQTLNKVVESFRAEHPEVKIVSISVIPEFSVNYYEKTKNPHYSRELEKYKKDLEKFYLIEDIKYQEDLLKYEEWKKEETLLKKKCEIARAKKLLKRERLL